MEQKTIISSLVIALVVSGVFWMARPDKVTYVTEQDEIIKEIQVGATASPDIQSSYLTFGGVREWAYHTGSFNTGTTTVCSFLSPAATSTLVAATTQITSATSTASSFDIAQSASPSATTTPIARLEVAASVLGTIVATNTPAFLTDSVVAPSTYINMKFDNGTGAINSDITSVKGRCSVKFREV